MGSVPLLLAHPEWQLGQGESETRQAPSSMLGHRVTAVLLTPGPGTTGYHVQENEGGPRPHTVYQIQLS